MIISASILTADFSQLYQEINRVEEAGIDMLHLDVMDGMFVPNISIGLPVVKSIRKITGMHLDVHLMIEKPERYIDEFAAAGADTITCHLESTVHPHRVVTRIKEYGCKAGVALNPSTPVDSLKWLIEEVDMVLQMTVNPGYGGQKYINSMTGKICDIKELINDSGSDAVIQVDGGINEKTIKTVREAGAGIAVVGAALFDCLDMNKAAARLLSD